MKLTQLSLFVFLLGLSFNQLNANPFHTNKQSAMVLGYLGPFQLIDPLNNTEAIVQSGSPLTIDFQWSDSDSAQEYIWIADTDSLNFTNPYFIQSTGLTNFITFYSGTLDAIAEGMGIAQGDTLELFWTALAVNGDDTLRAEQIFRISIIRFSEPPEPFEILSPANQSTIALNYDSTTTYRFTWNSTERGYFFHWHLESTTGNFQNPLWTIRVPGGALDTMLEISNWEIDSFLSVMGLPHEESAQLKWTVEAHNLFGSKLANTANLITLIRPADTTTVNSMAAPSSSTVIVYPNPVYDMLTVEWPSIWEQGTLYVYDALGELVLTQPMQPGLHRIDFSSYPSGFYSIKIFSEEETQDIKVIKY